MLHIETQSFPNKNLQGNRTHSKDAITLNVLLNFIGANCTCQQLQQISSVFTVPVNSLIYTHFVFFQNLSTGWSELIFWFSQNLSTDLACWCPEYLSLNKLIRPHTWAYSVPVYSIIRYHQGCAIHLTKYNQISCLETKEHFWTRSRPELRRVCPLPSPSPTMPRPLQAQLTSIPSGGWAWIKHAKKVPL
jgi:hypothetical protein